MIIQLPSERRFPSGQRFPTAAAGPRRSSPRLTASRPGPGSRGAKLPALPRSPQGPGAGPNGPRAARLAPHPASDPRGPPLISPLPPERGARRGRAANQRPGLPRSARPLGEAGAGGGGCRGAGGGAAGSGRGQSRGHHQRRRRRCQRCRADPRSPLSPRDFGSAPRGHYAEEKGNAGSRLASSPAAPTAARRRLLRAPLSPGAAVPARLGSSGAVSPPAARGGEAAVATPGRGGGGGAALREEFPAANSGRRGTKGGGGGGASRARNGPLPLRLPRMRPPRGRSRPPGVPRSPAAAAPLPGGGRREALPGGAARRQPAPPPFPRSGGPAGAQGLREGRPGGRPRWGCPRGLLPVAGARPCASLTDNCGPVCQLGQPESFVAAGGPRIPLRPVSTPLNKATG